MLVVVSISLLALILTFFESRGALKNGMFFGFILITLLGCIHYNYGNDYIGYHEMFNELTSFPLRFDYLVDNTYEHELGWVLLNHLFKHIGGFFMMVAVLNIIQNVIYYHFIKEEVAKKYWWLAIMIYLMSGSLYILNFSMMRQGLTIALFVLSWKYLKSRRILPALIILLIASTIHHSAQMVLPFVLLSVIPLNNRVIAVTYVVLLVALYVSTDMLSDVFASLSAVDELQSSRSLEFYSQRSYRDVASTYGLGFVLNLIPFVIAIWALIRKEVMVDAPHKLLITICMTGFIIAPFSQVLSIVGRFGMYFDAFRIATIPYIYSLLPQKWNQLLTGIFVLMLIYGYYLFFHSPVWVKDYSTFHTIFSAL